MKNIKFLEHRKRLGLSQVEVASRLGICKDYVNMIENNRRRPGFSLGKKFADLFGTTIDDLFFYQENEQNIQSND